MGRIIFGELTQGSSKDCKQMTTRWVPSKAKVDFLVRDLREFNDVLRYDRVPMFLDGTNF